MSIWLGVVRRQYALDHDPEVQAAKVALDDARREHEAACATARADGVNLRKATGPTRDALSDAEHCYTSLIQAWQRGERRPAP